MPSCPVAQALTAFLYVLCGPTLQRHRQQHASYSASYTYDSLNRLTGSPLGSSPTAIARAATASVARHPTAGDEVIHTTANHPWLTADHG